MNKLFLSLALLATGCYQYGPPQTEEGKVTMQMYHPAQQATAIGSNASQRGNVNTTVSSVYVPASYGLVFQCDHGQFAVSGTGERYKQLWEKLPVGTQVLIEYRIKYDNKGNFVGLDFLNANPLMAPLGDYNWPSKSLG